MVVREILDELSAIEQSITVAIRLLPEASQREEIQRRLESGLRRTTKTKQRIRACCQPLPVAAKYIPKPLPNLRRAA